MHAIVIHCNRMNHSSDFKGKAVVSIASWVYIYMCSVYCLHQSLSEQTSRLNQLLRNDGDKKNIAGNTNFYCTWNGYIFLSTTLAQLLDKYFNQLQWSRWSFWYVLLYTCRYRRGRSPLVRASGMASGSSTLVRNASLPSLVHPIHVPPPSTSLPPRIFFEPSPHHPTAFVGLH